MCVCVLLYVSIWTEYICYSVLYVKWMNRVGKHKIWLQPFWVCKVVLFLFSVFKVDNLPNKSETELN